MKNNYYEILGVTPDSDLREIKSAYRTLARKFHPDMAEGNINRFKEINEAYETLSNERKRMQYNMLFGFYRSAPTPPPPRKEPKKEKVVPPQDGSDLTAEIVITIPEAKNGTSKVVNILHTEQCPKCKGRKFINGSSCTECGGTGEITLRRKLTVTIPPNVKHETKLRIKGEGNTGKNGGKNGDLFLVIKIESPQNIRYEDKTVHYEVPIEPHEAVLGTTVSLKTLEGNILVKIPPRTKAGQKFRVQQNVQGKIFEIFVTVHIEIPAYLSHDEIKLYEKLRKLSNGNLRENFINE
ncbi:MAG: DnaJ domain-containing protein [Fusobacterium sp.]|nr:DnaJ domain-containing protein [Fusobacterium sp.]